MGRILIVDDDPGVRQVVHYLLQTHGYDSEMAEDGLQALCLLQHEDFNAVVTDVQMPHLDGLGLLREICRMEHPPPVIVQSGALDDSLQTQLRKAGAFRLMVKGAPLGDLLRAVLEACSLCRNVPANCA